MQKRPSLDKFNEFNKDNHLIPDVDKSRFEKLNTWDLGWEVLKPIRIAKSDKHELELSKRFSPGQKALYFFWYLDYQVTNGGFMQFYWNNYRYYLPTIIRGLVLIKDADLLKLLLKVDIAFRKHKELFELQKQLKDWEPLYLNLKEFDEFDKEYYTINTKTMKLIEQYIRLNPESFVNLI